MIGAILGAAALVGAIAGSVVAFIVHWEVADFLIRHSSYRNHSIGHLWQ